MKIKMNYKSVENLIWNSVWCPVFKLTDARIDDSVYISVSNSLRQIIEDSIFSIRDPIVRDCSFHFLNHKNGN